MVVAIDIAIVLNGVVMPFELESLVGHLYVAGGRTINTTPPGALVEVAPKRAARGRETDTYFTLVLPSGTYAPTSFYEQMATMSAERYFGSTGSVTSVLRNMFNTLNHNLHEHNLKSARQYEANMVSAVLRGEELYLARVGAAVLILIDDERVETLPEAIDDDEALFLPPLGVQPIPEVQMKRFRIKKGTRLLLVDANVAEIPLERIVETVRSETLEDVIDDYKALVTLQTQLIAAEFVPPHDPAPVVTVAGESSVQIANEINAAKARVQARTAAREDDSVEVKREPTAAERAVQQGTGRVAQGTGQGFMAIGQLLEKLTGGEPDPARKRLSAGAITTTVVMFPLVIVVIVVLSWIGNVGATEFEACVRQAADVADTARSMASSSPQNIINAWDTTIQVIDQCNELRPDDPTLQGLRREGQLVIDTLNNIKRREALPLTSFPGASISRLVLQGLDLYALDSANHRVHRVPLAADGRQPTMLPQFVTNMRQGARVDNFTVGRIIDIGFNENETMLVALDEQGVLVSCPPSFIMQCDAQEVLNSENWSNPVAINIWENRLYVLDVGSNQIWRYEQNGGKYINAPMEYFSGSTRPTLARAVDFDISSTGTTRGSVYILFSDGTMARYFQGEQLSFGFSDFPVGQTLSAENTTVGMFMNDSPVFPAFYIISRPARTIYETSLAGTYYDTYRVFDEEKFDLISDIAVDADQQIAYVASGNTIFTIYIGDET